MGRGTTTKKKEVGRKMTVVVVWKWVVRPEKQEANNLLMQKYAKWIKETRIKELKSVRVFTQKFGGISGSSIVLEEFDSLTDYEKCEARLLKEDKEYLAILKEFMQVIEPSELRMEVWNAAM